MTKQAEKRKPNKLVIILLVFVGFLLIGPGYLTWQTISRKQAFAEYIVANPEEVAIVTYTIGPDGEPVDDGAAIFHNADQPLVVASTIKLAVLAAYADGVTTGRFDPAEEIPVAEWEQFFVPGTDGGAHALGLQSVGLEADDLGFAVDQEETVPLDEIARMMIHYSGNAATDYLLTRIGEAEMERVLADIGLEQQTPIRLILGAALAIFNHEQPQSDRGYLQATLDDLDQGDTARLDILVDLYLNDPAWRSRQIEFMTSYTTIDFPESEIWAYQLLAGQLFPRGTAREYAHLMARIARGDLISPAASALMQGHLESVPSHFPLRLLYFDRIGAKDGVTAGVLALASYAVPKRGDLAGQERIGVIFANELTLDIWSRQLQVQGHYLLQTDLVRSTGVFEELEDLD